MRSKFRLYKSPKRAGSDCAASISNRSSGSYSKVLTELSARVSVELIGETRKKLRGCAQFCEMQDAHVGTGALACPVERGSHGEREWHKPLPAPSFGIGGAKIGIRRGFPQLTFIARGS